MELYLHSPIRLRGVVFKEVRQTCFSFAFDAHCHTKGTEIRPHFPSQGTVTLQGHASLSPMDHCFLIEFGLSHSKNFCENPIKLLYTKLKIYNAKKD
jgi:hypothetical protein